MSCGRGGLSFHRSSSFFALVLLLVRHPQRRPPSSRILYPCKPFFEDVEFNRLCLEAKLAVVKCRRFVMFKLGHRVEWGLFPASLLHSFFLLPILFSLGLPEGLPLAILQTNWSTLRVNWEPKGTRTWSKCPLPSAHPYLGRLTRAVAIRSFWPRWRDTWNGDSVFPAWR